MKKRERIDMFKEKARIDGILREAEITAKTPLLPCEDEEKVVRALRNIVNGEISREEYGETIYLVARSRGGSDIERLFNYFRSKQALATLRGEIIVTIKVEDPMSVISALTRF